jgi:TPR repeat protein
VRPRRRSHLTRAIEAGQRLSGANLAEIHRLRGSAHDTIGDFEAARQDYERAAAEAEASGELRTRWQALLDLGLLWPGTRLASSSITARPSVYRDWATGPSLRT